MAAVAGGGAAAGHTRSGRDTVTAGPVQSPGDEAICTGCRRRMGADERFCAGCGKLRDGLDPEKAKRAGESSVETAWREVQERLVAATAGRYDIVRELGRGGMAAVYLANEIRLKRQVAIKVMAPALLLDPDMVERFAREARTMASLYHPNIVTVFAVEEVRHLHFFVMQFIPGRSLDRVIRSGEKLSIPAVQAILYQAAAGIGHAHKQGVIHRDIKPANIMLDREGNAIVTDFGIAKVGEYGSTSLTVGPIGTPLYMSPEQCSGDIVTPATDQYSLGNVAYELLTGRPPFRGDTALTLGTAIVHQKPEPIRSIRSDCPADIDAAVLKMLSKQPLDRFGGLPEAMAALRGKALGEDDPVRQVLSALAKPEPPRPAPKVDIRLRPTAEPAPARVPTRPRLGRHWIVGAATIGALILLGIATREISRRGLEHRRAALLARVDTLVAGLATERPGQAELKSVLASARGDLVARWAAIATGNPARAALDSLAKELGDPLGRYPKLYRIATFDPATIPASTRAVAAVVVAQFANGSIRSGTGFAIQTRGDTAWIATTRHLVQDSLGAEAVATGVFFGGSERIFRATIMQVSDSADLVALVALIPGGAPVAPVIADSAAPGEPVAMIGFPSGLDALGDGRKPGAEPTAAVGSVTNHGRDHFEIDGYRTAGSSGSPVFNAAGRVVGMVVGARGAGDERRFYALPGPMLRALIAAQPPHTSR